MTNTIAIWLGIAILAFFAVDYFLVEEDVFIFLGRKLLDLLEFVAFWR